MDDFQIKSLILRDSLAVDRTHMANERTLMAYLRTSLMLLASGVSLIKLYPNILILKILGVSLLPVSLVIAVVSYIRFLKMKRRIIMQST